MSSIVETFAIILTIIISTLIIIWVINNNNNFVKKIVHEHLLAKEYFIKALYSSSISGFPYSTQL